MNEYFIMPMVVMLCIVIRTVEFLFFCFTQQISLKNNSGTNVQAFLFLASVTKEKFYVIATRWQLLDMMLSKNPPSAGKCNILLSIMRIQVQCAPEFHNDFWQKIYFYFSRIISQELIIASLFIIKAILNSFSVTFHVQCIGNISASFSI